MSVFLDDFDHFLGDGLLGLEFEGSVAVGVVKDHLVYLYRNTSKPLHSLPLFLAASKSRREQLRVLLYH